MRNNVGSIVSGGGFSEFLVISIIFFMILILKVEIWNPKIMKSKVFMLESICDEFAFIFEN